MSETQSPTISVIMPVYNAEQDLARVLSSLADSTYKPLECLVIDDSSTDGSAQIALEFGTCLVAMEKRGGPAVARNRGASLARGDILFFVDSDVCVRPATLARIAAAFAGDASLSALIGSYDDDPHTKDFLSQYRNLMHHYVHQAGREAASTFWSGCGAIRRTAFQEVSGFNESYGRPAIEDIELGYRLHQNHHKVLLDHDLTVKHLKRWTFWSLVKTDIFDRGIPWTELILRDRHMPNDLNIQLSQRVSVALAFLMVAVTAAAAVQWRGYVLTPLFALVFFLLARFWADAAAESRSKAAILGLLGAMLSIVLLATMHHMFGLIPPLVLSMLLLFSRHRYAGSNLQKRRLVRIPVMFYLLFSVLACLYYFPSHTLLFALFLIAATLGLLNSQFYLFLAAKRGIFFAAAAIPFHMLYHFYNGVSFLAGAARFWLTAGSVRSAAVQTTEPQSGEHHK